LHGCSVDEKNINSTLITPDRGSVSSITNETKVKESYKQFFLLSTDLKFDKDLRWCFKKYAETKQVEF
jgi:hypothetical protein